MGGSGGGFINWDKNKNQNEVLDEIRKKVDSDNFDSKVAELIASLMVDLNERPKALSGHMEEIKKALEKEIDGTIDLNFGGSMAKHTYVDGLSDIDSLVCLNNSELGKKSPEEVKSYFYDRLKDRFPNSEIKKSTLSVTIKFSDVEVQLLPATKVGRGFQIADASGENWSRINPKDFSKTLTGINEKTNNKLIPTIKLAKSIISTFPEKRRISGYHAEVLGVEVFKGYKGKMRIKDMLMHYFNESSKSVLKPIDDKTKQSVKVDGYLGGASNVSRQMISDSLSRTARRLEKFNLAQNLEGWKEVFGI